jgi:membrane protein
MTLSTRLQAFLTDFSRFPWKTTALTLRERFREDRLGLTASSLTFTTTIALVPLLTVALALFTAFPMFAKFQDVLQKWLMESLIPDNIARQVLGYLTQFAGRAGRLGWAGLTVLFFTALSLVFTIDRALNAIWRVRRPRSFGQRLLVYWAAITLGPLLIAASLSITSYLVGASRGSGGALPGGMRLVLDATEFMLIAGGLAAVYHYVPNARVRWSHAWAGAAVGALALEGARNVLTLYLKAVPTYSAVYGAFATVPILHHLDLRGMGHCAAGCGDRRLSAQPARRGLASRAGAGLALPARAGGAAGAGAAALRARPWPHGDAAGRPPACGPAAVGASCGDAGATGLGGQAG